MLIEVYITLLILAFSLLILGAFFGQPREREGKTGEVTEKNPKLLLPFTLLLLSAILFGIISLNSMNLIKTSCDSVVTQSVVSGDTTTFTNDILCEETRTSDEALAYFFGSMFFISILFLIIVTLKVLT